MSGIVSIDKGFPPSMKYRYLQPFLIHNLNNPGGKQVVSKFNHRVPSAEITLKINWLCTDKQSLSVPPRKPL